MIDKIITAIIAIFQAIPYFHKWFSKPLQQKVDEAKDKVGDELDDFEKNGRKR